MKSTGGFILSLIGGIGNILLGVLGAVVTFLLILVVNGVKAATETVANNGGNMSDFTLTLIFIFVVISLWFFVSGILLIIFSVRINNDLEVRKGSILCIVFGALSLNILCVVGGILGIVASKKPVINLNQPTQVLTQQVSSYIAS